MSCVALGKPNLSELAFFFSPGKHAQHWLRGLDLVWQMCLLLKISVKGKQFQGHMPGGPVSWIR